VGRDFKGGEDKIELVGKAVSLTFIIVCPGVGQDRVNFRQNP